MVASATQMPVRTNRRRFLIGNGSPAGGDPRTIAFLLA